jgi:hypothetical protein
MDTTFATAYTIVVDDKESIHDAILELVPRGAYGLDILLDTKFTKYWDYDQECLQYVASLWTTTNVVVDLATLPIGTMIALHVAQTTILSFEGVRFSVTVQPDGSDQHLVVHGAYDHYGDMLEMTFDSVTHMSMVDGLYPGNMLTLQGVQSRGRFLLHLVDLFNRSFSMNSSKLIDASRKRMCSGESGTDVPLQQLFLLARGSSWYMGHGFMPRDDYTNYDLKTETDKKRIHLAAVRTTTISTMYGKDARTVVELSGLPTGRNVNDFVGNMIIGDFFELLLMELFAGNNITCRGIHTILAMTQNGITRLGYNIKFYDFVKRYDLDEALPSRRLLRGVSSFLDGT